jgi:hypothetical protein
LLVERAPLWLWQFGGRQGCASARRGKRLDVCCAPSQRSRLTTARTAVHLGGAIARGNRPGHVERNYFGYGATGAEERTRRAVAAMCASLTPDRFVVIIDRERQSVLLHCIGRPDHEPDPWWLE